MSPLQIFFDNEYVKMPEYFNPSKLIQVIRIHKSQLSKEFIEYDTIHDKGIYKLDGDTYILLFLLNECGELWTTLRKWTPEREHEYKQSVGKSVECIIKKNYFEPDIQNYKLTDFTPKSKKVVSPF